MKKTEDTVKKEVRNNTTELVFILDKSGSMAGLESDTIGGFNGFVDNQRKTDGECFVTTVLFSDGNTIIHDRIPLSEVPKMTDKEYFVGGCTALVDAIGDTINHIAEIHKYARPEDVPAHTVFVITTDGLENASRKYWSGEVKNMISQKKELGWEFLFLGANIDAVETARYYGIPESRAVNYNGDRKGTRLAYAAMAKAVSCVRESGAVDESWSAEVAEDHKKRKSER